MKNRIDHNLSFADYRAIKDYVSITELNVFTEAPLLYKRQVLDGIKKYGTRQMSEGTAFHTAFLEPEIFAKTYRSSQKFDARTVEGKKAKAAQEELASNSGLEFLPEDTFTRIQEAAIVFGQHPFIKVHKIDLKVEKSFFWVDEFSQVKCKGRLDAFSCSPDFKDIFIFDVKTTSSAKNFEKSVGDYNYHRQAAFYIDGLKAALGIEPSKHVPFLFGVIELEAPYLNAVYQLNPEAIEQGRAEYQEQLMRIKECQERGFYPGLPTTIMPVHLPNYKRRTLVTEFRI